MKERKPNKESLTSYYDGAQWLQSVVSCTIRKLILSVLGYQLSPIHGDLVEDLLGLTNNIHLFKGQKIYIYNEGG